MDTHDSLLLDRLDHSAFTARHLRVYLTVLSGHFFVGFTISITGFVLPGIGATFGLSRGQEGIFSSALFAGMLVGAAAAGIVSDRMGRRYPLAASILVYAGFALLAGFAWNYPVLVGARALQGVGLGAEIAIVLPYIAEFVPNRTRGPMITAATATWLIGQPVAAGAAIGLVPALSWRSMFFVAAVALIIAVVVAGTVPESVRYLLRRGQTAQATATVEWLTRRSTSVTAASAAPPKVAEDGGAAGSVRGLLRGNYLRYTVAIWVMQVCGGAYLYGLATWLPTVLKDRGIGLVSGFGYTGIITGASVAGSLLAGQLVNQFGRRWTLAPALLLGGAMCLIWGAVSDTVLVVAVGALATFFGSGVAGATLYVYVGELYPTANRATGLGWAAAWQKVGGLIMPVTVGFVLSWRAPSYVFFVLFAVISVIAGAAGLAATFETRGKSMEQISTDLIGRTAARAGSVYS